VTREPLEYHRLLRGTPDFRWWTPLLLLLLSGTVFGMLTVVNTPVTMLLDPNAQGPATRALDTQRPVSVLVSFIPIILLLPAVLLTLLVMGLRPVGRIWSVAGRIRWGLLARLLGISVLAITISNLVGLAAGTLLAPARDPVPIRDLDAQAALLSMLLALLLVPLQSTAEEVVFRGLFMQVLGAWAKSPWVAILVPSLGFAFLHIYDVWGLVAIGLLGTVSAWLTWRTGGLEAAIAIHLINNYVAFGILASGVTGETAQTAGAGGPGGVIGQSVGLALFVWLTLRTFTGGQYERYHRNPHAASPNPVTPREGRA